MNKPVHMIILLIGVITLAGCEEKKIRGQEISERPLIEGVIVEELIPLETMDFHEVSGTVRSLNTSVVSAKVMGEVRAIKVRVSDTVRKGDLLLIINSPDTEARVQAASEALGEAEKSVKVAEEQKSLVETIYARYEQLHKEKAVSQQEFDNIKSRRTVASLEHERSLISLKKAEAGLKEAEALKTYTMIRSPVNGIIAETRIDLGSMTAPGMPLVIIEDRNYRVEAAADEGLISSVQIGTPVEVRISALGISSEGSVGEIVRSIDPGTRTFMVKIDVENSTGVLRGGLYAKVRFPIEQRAKLYVQENAVFARGELKGVYSVNDEGTVSLRIIKTGGKKDGLLEVLSGLRAGDRIIVDGVDRAVDGGRVR